MLPRVRFAVRSGVILGFGALCLWSVAGETRPAVSSASASLERYEIPGGDGYFALSLRVADLGTPVAHDHVVLVDTSASQTGAHREQTLKVLESALKSLPSGDRVRLFAIDVAVKPLTDEFVSPQSDEVTSALADLAKRVPLGATDLQPALETAAKELSSLDRTAGRARSIVYIGDGMSTGGLIPAAEFRSLVSDLRSEKIAVNSYCIGPRTDLQVLGLLATHTGGTVLIDELVDDARQSADKLGSKLAAAADAPVFYADKLQLSVEVDQLLPAEVPPLRADRDTIVLGKGHISEALEVTVTGAGGKYQWKVEPAALQSGSTFLTGLWQQAESSQGLAVAVAGSELLNVARQEYEDQVGSLVIRGRDAVINRDLKQAEQIAWAIRQVDPENAQAQTILNATQKVQARLASYQETSDAPPPEPGLDTTGTVRDEELTKQVEAEIRIRTERLTKEVRQSIEVARKGANEDPDAAISQLKRTLNSVVSATEIDPVDREQLRKRVNRALDELYVVKQRVELNRIELMRRRSAEQARRLAVDELVQRDEKLEQLIDKVRSLLAEGAVGREEAFEEAEAVARASWELAAYSGVAAAAIFNTEAAGQLDKIERLRYLRSDKFLEVLYSVEKAHVPFPDEPPVVYPAPEVWKALTERRKKWASVDLMRYNPSEERIREKLGKPTDVDFQEQPLDDAVNYLKEFHGIPIVLDRQTLIDEGITLDSPITLKLNGVSFKSVLKLMLENLQLTYVIEDEVMKITTTTKASEKLSTRVYPVADLVIPITTPQAGGIGQGLGGGGGIGGGGGAFGGGQFGGGGGFGGQQGGGGGGGGFGGGGAFNVADEAFASDRAPAEFNNDTVRDRKKKLATE